MGFKDFFRKQKEPRTPGPTQPAEHMVNLEDWTAEKAGYVLVRSRGQKTRYGALDLFRGQFSMVSGASDYEKAGLVQLGRSEEATFSTHVRAAENKAEFEARNEGFVAKVNGAIGFAKSA